MRLIRGWSERKIPMTLTNREGKLWITFYYQSKRYRKSLGLDDTKNNRKYATNVLLPEIQYKLNSGEFFNTPNEKKVPTVGEFAKVSLELHKSYRKQSTIYDYLSSLKNHILPYFENTPINQIKPSDLALWQNKVLERVSAGRLKNIRIVLNTILEDALNDEIITKNPFSSVKLPKRNPIIIHPFTLDEIKAILGRAEGMYQSFYAVGFFTGMRTGEIVGLKWEDIDFERKEIHISRSIRMGVESSPKTSNSIRTIDLLDSLVPYLKKQFYRTGAKQSYVFLTQNDTHIFDAKNIRDFDWTKLLKKLDLTYRPIYHMRHSFASMMIENGEDILWVSNMLGHKSSKTTLDRYAKFTSQKSKKRATFLQSFF